jgi:hypothetical protein
VGQLDATRSVCRLIPCCKLSLLLFQQRLINRYVLHRISTVEARD